MPSPQSRLYLKLVEAGSGGTSEACVEAAVQAGDVAALLIGANVSVAPEVGVMGLLAVAHANDVAVIIDQDLRLAQRLGADGVQIDASLPAYSAAREALGPEAIVGLTTTASRHRAMELAEAGATYVSFADDPTNPESLSVWWAEVMEVPCVLHVGDNDDAIVAAANAGVEFISPDETMWASPQQAAETVQRLNDLITTAGVAA